MPPLFPFTLAVYAVACTLYLSFLATAQSLNAPRLGRAANIALWAAFALHALDIGWLCTHGFHPGTNVREALSFVAWLTCGAYLFASIKTSIPVLGALIVPGTMVLNLAARFSPGSADAPGRTGSLLGALHITLATAGVALFAVAAGGAVVYLVEERNLKRHKIQKLFKRGPALETLDALNRRCIVFGFPLFTVAMITGALWIVRLPAPQGIFTVQYALASFAWLTYAVLLIARVTAGWRGRKAALMTLAGFGTSMLVLLGYFLRAVGSV